MEGMGAQTIALQHAGGNRGCAGAQIQAGKGRGRPQGDKVAGRARPPRPTSRLAEPYEVKFTCRPQTVPLTVVVPLPAVERLMVRLNAQKPEPPFW
jgi:hypothetical protein